MVLVDIWQKWQIVKRFCSFTGICLACSKLLNTSDEVLFLGLVFLSLTRSG